MRIGAFDTTQFLQKTPADVKTQTEGIVLILK